MMGDSYKGGSLAILPAYNEQGSIEDVVLKAKEYVDRVIVVDDGSTDETSVIAKLCGAEVIKHKKNRGYGAALQSCFEQARKYDANVMVVFDSDGQHDPSEIPILLRGINASNADVVIGSRFLNGTNGIPTYRKLGIKVLNSVTNAVSGLDISDTQSGYRAYSKNAINKISIESAGMSAGSEILIQAKRNDLKIQEVPINCKYDVDNPSTFNPVRHGISVLMGIVKTVVFDRPLFYFGGAGGFMFFMGFIFAMQLLWGYNFGGNMRFGGEAIFMMLFILSGLLTTFTGLMLYSINRLKKGFDAGWENDA